MQSWKSANEDAFHTRVFIASIGLDLEAESGAFLAVFLNISAQSIEVEWGTKSTDDRIIPQIARLHEALPTGGAGRILAKAKI
jgi:hypothetical protein